MSGARCLTSPITPQQRATLELAAAGMSDKEIARALRIHHGTVGVHLLIVYRKLGVRNRTEAALKLLRGEVEA